MKLQTDRMIAQKDGGIGWITFNNPARHNAVSLPMWQGLFDAVTAFAEDPEVRVIVLKGAGEKPVECPVFQGLRVGPVASDSIVAVRPSSGSVVLPRLMSPVASICCT